MNPARLIFRFTLLGLALLASGAAFGVTPTDTPSWTPTSTPSSTRTWTRTWSPTSSPTQTPAGGFTSTSTHTPSPSRTATPTVTQSFTITRTNTPSPTRTITPAPGSDFCENWDGGSTSFSSWIATSQSNSYPGNLSLQDLGAPSFKGLRLDTAANQWSSGAYPGYWSNVDFSATVVSGGRGFMLARIAGGAMMANSYCDTCYAMQFLPTTGQISFWSFVSGLAVTPLAQVTIAPVGAPYKMRFVVSDTQMDGYINDSATPNLSFSGSFGANPGGGFGVMAYNGASVYDNIDMNNNCGFPSLLGTPSITPTPSATLTPTRSVSVTSVYTPTISPTPTPSYTPGGMSNAAVDNFEDGDLQCVNGGIIYSYFGAGCTQSTTILGGGCSYGSTLNACRLTGTAPPAAAGIYAYTDFTIAGGAAACDLGPWASEHSFSFSYRAATTGHSYYVCLVSPAISDGDHFCYSFSPANTGWNTLTVYFPDVPAASGLPRFSQGGFGAVVPWSLVSPSVTACRIGLVTDASTQGYTLDVDDLTFAPAPTGGNLASVATALGAPISEVVEASSYGLGDFMTWLVIRLAVHCGCHPHDILQMRDTMSWGEIAVSVGSDWTTIYAECMALMAGVGLQANPPSAIELDRILSNHPSASPVPTPKPYISSGGFPLNSAIPGCPW